jgi:hypothetical protein
MNSFGPAVAPYVRSAVGDDIAHPLDLGLVAPVGEGERLARGHVKQ